MDSTLESQISDIVRKSIKDLETRIGKLIIRNEKKTSKAQDRAVKEAVREAIRSAKTKGVDRSSNERHVSENRDLDKNRNYVYAEIQHPVRKYRESENSRYDQYSDSE
jgi:phenylalanyl-tRNA synthetase alpha subunit